MHFPGELWFSAAVRSRREHDRADRGSGSGGEDVRGVEGEANEGRHVAFCFDS